MASPFEFSFPRYLAAKKSVDDRALNRFVWQQMDAALRGRVRPGRPLQILEVGAGAGAMIERIVDWGLLAGPALYVAVDAQRENIDAARRLAAGKGFPAGLRRTGTTGDDNLLEIELHAADLFDFIARPEQQGRYDLLIAHAVLDLLDLPTALAPLLATLAPGGLCYFTINFDGVTVLEPAIDPALDAQIEALYHRSMDERLIAGKPSGDSRSGRRLLLALPAAGATLLAAGSSDWIVHAVEGAYPAGEAYFLHCILHFFQETLTGHPELEAAAFEAWLARRRQQIGEGSLIYIAHQIDLLGRVDRSLG